MLKDKPFRLCSSFLVLMVFAGVGSAYGQEPYGNELSPTDMQQFIWGNPGLSEKNLLF